MLQYQREKLKKKFSLREFILLISPFDIAAFRKYKKGEIKKKILTSRIHFVYHI